MRVARYDASHSGDGEGSQSRAAATGWASSAAMLMREKGLTDTSFGDVIPRGAPRGSTTTTSRVARRSSEDAVRYAGEYIVGTIDRAAGTAIRSRCCAHSPRRGGAQDLDPIAVLGGPSDWADDYPLAFDRTSSTSCVLPPGNGRGAIARVSDVVDHVAEARARQALLARSASRRCAEPSGRGFAAGSLAGPLRRPL